MYFHCILTFVCLKENGHKTHHQANNRSTQSRREHVRCTDGSVMAGDGAFVDGVPSHRETRDGYGDD
jgi:hypothetical protein